MDKSKKFSAKQTPKRRLNDILMANFEEEESNDEKPHKAPKPNQPPPNIQKALKEDLSSLDGKNQVEEVVMDGYMNLLMDYAIKNIKDKKFVSVPSSFYTLYANPMKLSFIKGGLKNAVEMIKNSTNINLNMNMYKNVDEIYFPVQHNVHWLFIRVVLIEKKFYIYDSISENDDEEDVINDVKKSVIQLLKELYKKKFTSKIEKVPQQRNQYDCGIFTMEYARRLLLNQDINGFTEAVVPNFRQRIKKELQENKLDLTTDYSIIIPRQPIQRLHVPQLDNNVFSNFPSKVNKNVINSYLIHCYNTFAIKDKIRYVGIGEINKINNQERIDKYDLYFLPIYKNNRWLLIDINFHNRCIRIYDPKLTNEEIDTNIPDEKFYDEIIDEINNEIKKMGIQDLDEEYMPCAHDSNIPKKSDGGLYVLEFIYRLMKSTKKERDVSEIKNRVAIRNRIINELRKYIKK